MGDMHVGLSEEVSYLPDFGTMVCKDGPIYVVIAFCLITLFGIRLCFCLYLFPSLVICFGNLLLLGVSCILIRSVFLFPRDSGRAVILLTTTTILSDENLMMAAIG